MPIAVPEFKVLDVAIVGGGIGGLSAAVALRRAGHKVTIYERRSFDVEVGASISCAANGTQWLREWGVDIPSGRPITLLKLVMRDWKSGEILNQYDLTDYEKTWGNVYNMFHRQDMHKMLLETAISKEGKGTPCTIVIDHVCKTLDPEAGIVTFTNGSVVKADLVIGADGIRSVIRQQIGVEPDVKSAAQTCYRCNVKTEDVKRLGLPDFSVEPAIQFWGGYPTEDINKYYKIVMSPCSGGDVVSFYCFMPTELTKHHEEGFSFAEVPVADMLQGKYDVLDPECARLLSASIDRMPWRLYVHQPYSHWYKGKACVLGDAAHPMMPHQSQGACTAIEDAGALGIIFSKEYPAFSNDVAAGLDFYQRIRKPRATRVQAASARATENLNERIGFSSLDAPSAKLAAQAGKLTVNEMNEYVMADHIRMEYEGALGGVTMAIGQES